nr:hypothetical protein [uncultured Draconibacterium sp.]
MKSLFKLIFGLGIIFSVISCSDDSECVFEQKSEGEIVGEKISELAVSENISLATTYSIHRDNITIEKNYDERSQTFRIEGAIIIVGDSYYNLINLLKYEVINSELYLQFEDI